MMPRRWSLRRRLLAWLLIPLVLVCAGLLADTYVNAIRQADKAYDRLLMASALAIAERVVAENGRIEVDLPYVALEMFSSAAQDRVFYRVTGPQEEFVTGYRDLPGLPEDAEDTTVFYDADYRGSKVRVAILRQPVSGPGVRGQVEIQVAQTRNERDLLTREIVLGAGIRLALLVLCAAVLIWVGVAAGLAPLRRLQQAVQARSPQDLAPLDGDVPREVRALVAAINDLMQRLDGSMGRMRRFIADASHQLRTPLSALKTQTELALRGSDPDDVRESLTRVHESTRRTSRLADQLLTLAKAEPGGASHRQDRGRPGGNGGGCDPRLGAGGAGQRRRSRFRARRRPGLGDWRRDPVKGDDQEFDRKRCFIWRIEQPRDRAARFRTRTRPGLAGGRG